MNKHIILVCLIFNLFTIIVNAQDNLKIAEDTDSKKDTKAYSLTSLDGKVEKIYLIPDYSNRVLKISCLKDTIKIFDYWGVPPDVRLLNTNFLKIEYAVRGGSDLGLGNLLVLCVSGDKLFEAMHVLRYINSDASYVIDSEKFKEQSNYNIKVALNGYNKKNYKLNVNIHDIVLSEQYPETNYNYNDQTILDFDERKHVFYSVKENIYDRFNVFDPKIRKSYKQGLRGNFPVIILGKETYYFLNDGWYALGKNNELDKYTSHSSK